MAVDLVLLQRPADSRSVNWTSSFFYGSRREGLRLESDSRGESGGEVLVERVVYLIREGVTRMDLLEVFLRRRIQPLQARDHPMWMYSGIEDSTRVHPEEVNEDTVENWLRSTTRNKDNPRGARRIPPLDQSYEPDKVRF